jgi:hypothetical protein
MNADSQYRLFGLSMGAAKKTQQMQTALKKERANAYTSCVWAVPLVAAAPIAKKLRSTRGWCKRIACAAAHSFRGVTC